MRFRQTEVAERDRQSANGNPTRPSEPELKTGWAGAERIARSSQCSVHNQPGFDWTAADVYLFDIDGTLLNSRDAVHYRAFHRAVKEVFGLDFRIDGVPVHGNTDVGILRAYLEVARVPENEWRPRLAEALEVMSADVEHNSADLRPELCPAVLALIQQLTSQRKLLGIASGNLERVGWAKLRACHLRDSFSFGAFSGTLEKRDDVISHGIQRAREIRGRSSKVYVVGDTPSDIRSAHANGIPAIAVATGIYSVDELLAHEPEMCVSCCEDLLQA